MAPTPPVTLGGAVTTGGKAEGSEDPSLDGRFCSVAPSFCRVSFLQDVPGAQWWSGPRPTRARALGQTALRRWAPPSCAAGGACSLEVADCPGRGGGGRVQVGVRSRAAVVPGGGEPRVGVLRLCRLLTIGRRDGSRRRALTTAPPPGLAGHTPGLHAGPPVCDLAPVLQLGDPPCPWPRRP